MKGKEPFRMSTGHPVSILKGSSLKGGENDKQYVSAGKKLIEGSSFPCAPVDDVIIKGNYVQIADFL